MQECACVVLQVERGLSGGEIKRVSIVNELLSDPQLLILDEPMTGVCTHLIAITALTGCLPYSLTASKVWIVRALRW